MFLAVYGCGILYPTKFSTLFIQIIVGIFLYGCLALVYFYITKDAIIFNTIKKIKAKISKKQNI